MTACRLSILRTAGLRRIGKIDRAGAAILAIAVVLFGCSGPEANHRSQVESIVNFDHLDHLLEIVEKDGVRYGIVHIYAEAPDYEWVHDDDEGAVAVDDVARAAVLYLRRFELTGASDAREKAEALLNFLTYMQTRAGLSYNFVWNSELDINREHTNSRADSFTWWAARSVWAFGRCAEVTQDVDTRLAESCRDRARRTYPHLQQLLSRFGETVEINGRTYPTWLIQESAADATSELLLGLQALQRAYPDPSTESIIRRFEEGIRMMQFGDPVRFPYGAHASWIETWHAWGNAQTSALAQSSDPRSAELEATSFYPRLLIDGWMHSLDLADSTAARRYEQIAYGVRCVATGLIRLYDRTGDDRFAKMAGLAGSWFTGNNDTGIPMYDPATGRGFDGIQGPDEVNYNAGAESTIEALYTLQEIEARPAAEEWLYAIGEPARELRRDGKEYRYRIFANRATPLSDRRLRESTDVARRHVGLVMNITDGELLILEDEDLKTFLRQ